MTLSARLIRTLAAGLCAATLGCGQPAAPETSFAAAPTAPAGLITKADGADEELIHRALEVAADRAGVSPDQLEVTAVGQPAWAALGLELTAFKIADAEGEVTEEVLLSPDGEVFSRRALDAEALEVERAATGGLSAELIEAIAADPDAPLPLLIYLAAPDFEALPRPDGSEPMEVEAIDLFLDEALALREEQVRGLTEPFAEALRAMGGEEVGASPLEPVVTGSLRGEQALELAGNPAIEAIDLGRQMDPSMTTARATAGVDVSHQRGLDGSNVRLAIIEVGGRAASGNPFLSFTQDTAKVCATASAHTTAVTGIAAGDATVDLNPGGTPNRVNLDGGAPDATVRVGGSCGGSNSELQDAGTRAVKWGARVLNLSWGDRDPNGTLSASSRFWDGLQRNSYRLVVQAIGNDRGRNDGFDYVDNPGAGYNVLAVGNIDDRGTANRGDDRMAADSSARDPKSRHGDREKPEVSAPGTDIQSLTTASPWHGNVGGGTSYAAPLVAGAAAGLIERRATLGVWPEALKAIFIATAWHNVEGATRVSDVDGAGGIRADRADDVVRGRDGGYRTRSTYCSDAKWESLGSVTVAAGRRTRVAMVWDTDPTDSNYTRQPSADYDLWVTGPDGTHRSSSWDRTWELVEFTPAQSGTYTVLKRAFRCDKSPRWMAWAWAQE